MQSSAVAELSPCIQLDVEDLSVVFLLGLLPYGPCVLTVHKCLVVVASCRITLSVTTSQLQGRAASLVSPIGGAVVVQHAALQPEVVVEEEPRDKRAW